MNGKWMKTLLVGALAMAWVAAPEGLSAAEPMAGRLPASCRL
jgi:hypothetical protein